MSPEGSRTGILLRQLSSRRNVRESCASLTGPSSRAGIALGSGPMARRPTARDMERVAAARPPRLRRPPAPPGEALGMLARRGLRPSLARPDLPFPSGISAEIADALAEQLGHYAFRLFVRGVIRHGEGFTPAETTSYVSAAQARTFTETLIALGVVAASGHDRYRLVRRAGSFGGTLEWYVGHELRRWLGFDVATGVKFHARGIGGDLDLVAAAEGKLIYAELKSSPPKHLSDGEIGAFVDRVCLVRPDLALFVVDTALRLSDKVVPMLTGELARRSATAPAPCCVDRELWSVGRHLYVVNSRPDLMTNIGRVIAEGLLAQHPSLVERKEPACEVNRAIQTL
jgi:hypothetical protein